MKTPSKEMLGHWEKRIRTELSPDGIAAIAVYHRDEQAKMVKLIAFAGEEKPREHAPFGGGILGQVAQSGVGTVVDVDHQREKYRSIAYVPIRYQDNFLGILMAASYVQQYFRDSNALQALAAQLGVLWVQPDSARAIAVDIAVEKIAGLSSNFHWSGIYRLDNGILKLVAYRGAPTPHAEIPETNGICGAAVRENQTLNIADVQADDRYLSCDTRTKSELVVPIRNPQGAPIAEIDIDSHFPNVFTPQLTREVEAMAVSLAPLLDAYTRVTDG